MYYMQVSLNKSVNFFSTLQPFFLHKNFFRSLINRTVFVNNKEISRQLEASEKLSNNENMANIADKIIIYIGLNFCFHLPISGKETFINVASMTFSQVAIIAPFIEEIVFRSLSHTYISYIQEYGKYCAPKSIKKNCFFKWLISPSARITLAGTLFAAAHLINGYPSSGEKVRAVAFLTLFPTYSLLYETSGFLSSVAAHSANNAFALCLCKSVNFFCSG